MAGAGNRSGLHYAKAACGHGRIGSGTGLNLVVERSSGRTVAMNDHRIQSRSRKHHLADIAEDVVEDQVLVVHVDQAPTGVRAVGRDAVQGHTLAWRSCEGEDVHLRLRVQNTADRPAERE